MAKTVYTPEEKKILTSMFLRSHTTFVTFNMVKMEGNSFTFSMIPAIESIYGDDEAAKKEAYGRHQAFFNTHAVPFSMIVGMTYAMEKQYKEGNMDAATIGNIKAALMGPTAGMFDSLFFNCIRVIAAGIAIGLCEQGNVLGTIIFIALYGCLQSVAKYILLTAGYSVGTTFIDQLFNSGLLQNLTKCAGVLGLMMIGAMTASMVSVPITLSLNTGAGEVVVLDIINEIFPGLLAVVYLFLLVALIKKGKRPTQLILYVFIFALLGALIGIF